MSTPSAAQAVRDLQKAAEEFLEVWYAATPLARKRACSEMRVPIGRPDAALEGEIRNLLHILTGEYYLRPRNSDEEP